MFQSTVQHQSSPPFSPFFEDEHGSQVPSRNRSTSSSIWAPKPSPTWPIAIESFARDAEQRSLPFPPAPPSINTSNLPPMTREHCFSYMERKPIGAVGEGRKKTSPTLPQDAHVEQLLRALDLNSPTPFIRPLQALPPVPSSNGNGLLPFLSSPDLSPISNTSLLTPKDSSPAGSFEIKKLDSPFAYESAAVRTYSSRPLPQPPVLFSSGSSASSMELPLDAALPSPYDQSSFAPPSFSSAHQRSFSHRPSVYTPSPRQLPLTFAPFSSAPTPIPSYSQPPGMLSPQNRLDLLPPPPLEWQHQMRSQSWLQQEDRISGGSLSNGFAPQGAQSSSYPPRTMHEDRSTQSSHEPINFLSLLHPSSSPPYPVFVSRIIKSSDQQASIFLQQKLKVADTDERAKIIDAICARGFEMMAHRFGNWAVQRCFEAATSAAEHMKIVSSMRGRIVELATNCYGCHVLQKALDCEERVRLMIVSELLIGDPAQTLVNKHASHVWSKIMELTWSDPAPPIFAFINKSLKGKWASLACHETGSLVVQHAFENLEDSAKNDIINELLNEGLQVFTEIAKNQWGSYCIQHILEHGSEEHRNLAISHLVDGLLDFATNEQGSKSLVKALKDGGKPALDKIVQKMCEPSRGARRATIVDLALSGTGSQLIANVLPSVDKDQRQALYDCIRGHIVTLRGCKTGSKVIWLFDRMRAYYGY